jgi:hypothetical protein
MELKRKIKRVGKKKLTPRGSKPGPEGGFNLPQKIQVSEITLKIDSKIIGFLLKIYSQRAGIFP